jgi:outer membrane protein OmpA-like peptidoglycan-associated protein
VAVEADIRGSILNDALPRRDSKVRQVTPAIRQPYGIKRMKILQRLLLASTVVSGFVWTQVAGAEIAFDSGINNRNSQSFSLTASTELAQAAEPDQKLKPKPVEPPKKPSGPVPAAPPKAAPPKPSAAPVAPPEHRQAPPPAPKPPEHKAPLQSEQQAPGPTPPPAHPAVQGPPPALHNQQIIQSPGPNTARPTPPAGQGGVVPSGSGAPQRVQTSPPPTSGNVAPSAQQTRPIAPAVTGAGIAPQSVQGQPLHRVDQLRSERHESVVGGQTIIREVDRTIIREGSQTIIRHDEGDRFRYGAQDVRTERRGDDNVTIVMRPNGDRIVTVVNEHGFLLRRSRILPDGREIIIIENRPSGRQFEPGFGTFIVNLPPPVIRIPRDRYIVDIDGASQDLIYQTLMAPPVDFIERRYTLDEIRYSGPLRDRMPRIDLNTVNFDTGSWELSPEQVDRLAGIAAGLNRVIERNPSEVFLIEGFTDAVGSDVDNLSLSDRRAETVAIALTQQFGVPPENLSTQGYGEQYLKIPTPGPERANRRVTVQRITPLITGQAQ